MKLVNHIDHVTWVSNAETIEENVAKLCALFDVQFDGPKIQEQMGFAMYLCWEAGLEVVCPLPDVKTAFNKILRDRLESHGEGLMGVVFGVSDLDAAKQRLEKAGFNPGELWSEDPAAPWRHKVSVKERSLGFHLNTWMIFGEIDYADGVVTTE